MKNTLILFNCGEACRIPPALIKNLAELSYSNQTVALSAAAHSFSDGESALKELIPKLVRYSRLYMVNPDGKPTELHNYSSVFADMQSLLAVCARQPERGLSELKALIQQLHGVEMAQVLAFRMLIYLQENLQQESCENPFPAFLGSLSQMKTTGEVADFLASCVSNFYISQNYGPPYRNFILKTLRYAREHMDDPGLSLKKISETYLYMNTDYVSREFYKETGEKFSAYLNRIRMERAKELLVLANEEDKIYRIAEQVGCSNARHFSHAFRKYTGISPSRYIQQHKKSQE